MIKAVLDRIIECGVEVFPKPTGEILIDVDDLVFYEVAMEKRCYGESKSSTLANLLILTEFGYIV